MESQNINDDYFVIALHIFESCGSQENEFLTASTVMDVMAPFIGCDKSEYAFLQSLLDPDKIDPVISVKKLSSALQEYSQRHNSKIDNCFGVVNSNITIESPISIEGYRELLADLQCELREKTHLIAKLKQQMEFSDKQHDEVLASLTVERDSLQTHLQLVRDENTSLMFFKNEYDEMSEWSHSIQEQLAENNAELDALRKKTKVLQESVEKLESEKQILTEKIAKCKDEYQKINDIYHSKNAILSDDNEMLKGEMADLSARYYDQDKYLQQVIKEKVLVEVELKDILNRSNDVACLRLNQSIDVSYSDASMLRILDSMNQSDRESKLEQFSEDLSIRNCFDSPGCPSNISLFEELKNAGSDIVLSKGESYNCDRCLDIESKYTKEMQTQTDDADNVDVYCKTCMEKGADENNNGPIPCLDCEHMEKYVSQLESDISSAKSMISKLQNEVDCYEVNQSSLSKVVECLNSKNESLDIIVDSLKTKVEAVDDIIASRDSSMISTSEEVLRCNMETQTDNVDDESHNSSHSEVACPSCTRRSIDSVEIKPHNLKAFSYVRLATKNIFQFFAMLCFLLAVFALYNIMHYHFSARRCIRSSSLVPWDWMSIQDVISLILKIEYVGEVPM